MAQTKQDKAIGNLVKSVGRLIVLVVMTPLWFDFSLEGGLQMGARTGDWCAFFPCAKFAMSLTVTACVTISRCLLLSQCLMLSRTVSLCRYPSLCYYFALPLTVSHCLSLSH